MKKIVVSVFFIMMYFIVCSHVDAVGSVSLSASKDSVNVGDTFTVSVNLSGTSVATLTTRLSMDDEKVQYVSGPANSNYSNGRIIYTWTDPNGGASPVTGGTIATFTFKAKSAGSANFGISGDFFTQDETLVNPSFSGVTVTISNAETSNSNQAETGGQTGNQNENQQTGETGNANGGTTEGQTGNQADNQNTNQGTTATENSENNVNNNQQNSLSSNNNLRTLRLNVEGISPSFSNRTTQYYITILEDINDIDVIAEPEDSKATVQITGNTNIPSGSSKISVIVTAENGNKKEYSINVSKTRKYRTSQC